MDMSAGNVSAMDDFRSRAKEFSSEASERIRDYWDEYSPTLRENLSTILIGAGVIAAAGFLGLYMSRRGSEEESESMLRYARR
jgi:hypothetical protein